MKKALSVLLIAGVLSVSMTACKKDKAEDCTALAQAVSDKGAAYMTSSTAANCNAYKAALNDYVNSSCSQLTADQKALYQEMIADLDCQ
ncbi:MAG TPA: hypothetical protein VD996_03365 [Chitinophagaceae bacterium]|nr:hypothetical protein [Chitinophagaceae bacterium]